MFYYTELNYMYVTLKVSPKHCQKEGMLLFMAFCVLVASFIVGRQLRIIFMLPEEFRGSI